MKISLTIATLVGCAALAACGGGEDTATNADTNLATEDLNAGMADMNMAGDNLTVDANNVTVIENGGTDMNMDATNGTAANTTNGY